MKVISKIAICLHREDALYKHQSPKCCQENTPPADGEPLYKLVQLQPETLYRLIKFYQPGINIMQSKSKLITQCYLILTINVLVIVLFGPCEMLNTMACIDKTNGTLVLLLLFNLIQWRKRCTAYLQSICMAPSFSCMVTQTAYDTVESQRVKVIQTCLSFTVFLIAILFSLSSLYS